MLAKKTTAKRLRNDLLLVFALLLTACVLGIGYFLLHGAGDTVVVSVDRQIYGEYPLHEDRVLEIRTGDALNVLVIRGGTAYVESANCPDGICSAHRPISRDGESIVCLPHRLVVTVYADETSEPDVVI